MNYVRKKQKILKFVMASLLIGFTLLYYVPANADSNNLSISTTPDQVLFDVSNIKPGDWFERELTVENDGEMDLVYYIDSRMINGSEKLYNHLVFSIQDSSGDTLYEGKLGNYGGLNYRELSVGNKEELMLVAEFPAESGNEFQGLETNFAIRVHAREEPIEDPPEDIEIPDEGDIPDEYEDELDGIKDNNDSNDDDSEEQVKGGSVLPQTGEEIPVLFYVIGGSFLISGLLLYLWTRRLARDQE